MQAFAPQSDIKCPYTPPRFSIVDLNANVPILQESETGFTTIDWGRDPKEL